MIKYKYIFSSNILWYIGYSGQVATYYIVVIIDM